jgi:thiazole synthase
MLAEDIWQIGGESLRSRLFLGTSRYPSLDAMRSSIEMSGAQVITVSLRRELASGGAQGRFWDFIRDLPVRILPNTAGCFTAKEAVTTAEMARDLFETHWIKLEVIGCDVTLQPNPFSLVDAAEQLVKKGFEVFPYTTDDLMVCQRLVDVGCQILMPWAAPIGTGRGIIDPLAIELLRRRFPRISLIVDAGLGRPSHAAQALELGCDGVLLNTAVATAGRPPWMAQAFGAAVDAGRQGYLAGLMESRATPQASTPMDGKAVFDFHS